MTGRSLLLTLLLPLTVVAGEGTGSLRGKLTLDRPYDFSLVSLTLRIENEPADLRGDSASPVPMQLTPTGEFQADCVTPARYVLTVEGPGLQRYLKRIDCKAGELTDVGTIVVVRQKLIRLVYIMAARPTDKWSVPLRELVRTGENWKPAGVKWPTIGSSSGPECRSALTFRQVDAQVFAKVLCPPARLADLGAGKLIDFKQIRLDTLVWLETQELSLQDGHVYLMNHKAHNYWTVFEVSLSPPLNRGRAKVMLAMVP